jgi:Contractile injection system tube protein
MQRNSSYEARDYGKLWTHKGNKFVIGTLQGDEPLEITAQYNPKELSRTASAAWNVHPNTSARQSPNGETNIWMEYKSTEPRSLTFELVFDGYEEGISVAPLVEQLESLTLPKDMSSRRLSDRHPRACVAVWGSQSLRCVVMSVATKLSMFDESGEPLRATCSVTLKETDVVAMMANDKDKSGYQSRQDQIASHNNAKKHETRRHWVNDKPVADAWSKPQASTPPAAKPAPVAKAATAPAAAPTPAPVEQKVPPVQTEAKTPPDQTEDPNTPMAQPDAQDDEDDRAADAKPETFEPGTSKTPAGNYQTGTASTPGDGSANQIEASGPAKPTTFEPGTSQTPAGNYQTGQASTPASESADQIEATGPAKPTTYEPGTSQTPAGNYATGSASTPGGESSRNIEDSDPPAPAPIVVPKDYKPPTDLE